MKIRNMFNFSKRQDYLSVILNFIKTQDSK